MLRPCFDENTNEPLRPLPRSLLRPHFRNTHLELTTKAIYTDFDSTTSALFNNPGIHCVLMAICLRGLYESEFSRDASTKLEFAPAPWNNEQPVHFSWLTDHDLPLAWFPYSLLGTTEFRSRIEESFMAMAQDEDSAGRLMPPAVAITPDCATRWMRDYLLQPATCLPYTWLLTALVRVNYAQMLFDFGTYDTSLTYQNAQFVDSHMPLIATYQTLAASPTYYSVPDTHAIDPGLDVILETMWESANELLYTDPLHTEIGTSVMKRLKPSDQYAECLDNMPAPFTLVSQSSRNRENRIRLPIVHAMGKAACFRRCQNRQFGQITTEWCGCNMTMCAFLRRVVYITLVGGHGEATIRPSFTRRLGFFTELILPEALAANINFEKNWCDRREMITYVACREFIVMLSRHHSVFREICDTDLSMVRSVYSAITCSDMIRFHLNRIPTPGQCQVHEIARLGLEAEDIARGVVFDKMRGELLKEGAVMNDVRRDIVGLYAMMDRADEMTAEDAATVMELLETMCRLDISARAASVHAKATHDIMFRIAENIKATHTEDLQWMTKMQKVQCLGTIFSEMNKVHESYWKLTRKLPFDQRPRYPEDWDRRVAQVQDFFESRPPWKRRSTYQWTLAAEAGVRKETVCDLIACEELYHAAKPEAHIALVWTRILMRNYTDFLHTCLFVTRLYHQVSCITYDLPAEVRLMQEEMMRVRQGLMDTPTADIPTFMYTVYVCPSCDTIRSTYAGSRGFMKKPHKVGVAFAKADPETGCLYCSKTHETSYNAKESKKNKRKKEKEKLAGKKADKNAGPEKRDDKIAEHLARVMMKNNLNDPCEKTLLTPIDMRGKLLLHHNKFYCLCTQCCTVAPFDLSRFEGPWFVCGLCDSVSYKRSAFNPVLSAFCEERFKREDAVYDAIATDPEAYRHPTEWPVEFSDEAREDALHELAHMDMPVIAREKAAEIESAETRERLKKFVKDKRCRMCIDPRWAEADVERWSEYEVDEAEIAERRGAHERAPHLHYTVINDLDTNERRGLYRFSLCIKHALYRKHSVFDDGMTPHLSEFILELRNQLRKRKDKVTDQAILSRK